MRPDREEEREEEEGKRVVSQKGKCRFTLRKRIPVITRSDFDSAYPIISDWPDGSTLRYVIGPKNHSLSLFLSLPETKLSAIILLGRWKKRKGQVSDRLA